MLDAPGPELRQRERDSLNLPLCSTALVGRGKSIF